MSMPFYVSPEQAMKDKADYARKNIARGRNTIVIQFADGILFVAPLPISLSAQEQETLLQHRAGHVGENVFFHADLAILNRLVGQIAFLVGSRRKNLAHEEGRLVPSIHVTAAMNREWTELHDAHGKLGVGQQSGNGAINP